MDSMESMNIKNTPSIDTQSVENERMLAPRLEQAPENKISDKESIDIDNIASTETPSGEKEGTLASSLEEAPENKVLDLNEAKEDLANFKIPVKTALPPPKPRAVKSEGFVEPVPVTKEQTQDQVSNADKKSDVQKLAKNKLLSQQAFSPAERLKQANVVLPYLEPPWSGLCQTKYYLEILKNGKIIGKVDLMEKPFYVFGRLASCDVQMEHPSLSRYHSVLQFCGKPDNLHHMGWYIYDLESTHGTLINKTKVRPRSFTRLRVGHVIKFGGSTRLYILQVSLHVQCR